MNKILKEEEEEEEEEEENRGGAWRGKEKKNEKKFPS